MHGAEEIWGENHSHYSESMMTYPPRGARDSESWPPSPDDTSNKLTNLSKEPWDNGIFDALLPQKICQIILYK